jgi:hypothetical protein
MNNKLIENKTGVFYTVRVKKGLYVESADIRNTRVISVSIANKSVDATCYENNEVAKIIAEYTGGKVIKHMRTTVITEVTTEEPIEIEEEFYND